MKNSTEKRCKSKFQNRLTALLSLLVVWVLALPAPVAADEFPVGCSLSGGGLGNTSQGGINFPLSQAHVGDTVPVVPSLGMVLNACQAINATGSVWLATGKLTNFLINVTLDPGPLITCPTDPLCRPGPYNVLITPALVGVGVNSPNGSIPGSPKTVRAVQNGEGTVRTGATPEQLADFHTATIAIVTPCIAVVKQCAYPSNSPTCFPAGSPIDFTGYVTNCGDIRLTNVTVLDSRTPNLFTPAGLPLFQPLILDPGQAVPFKGSFLPTLAETCAGSAANTITVRGTDITVIQGPNASVTNQTTVSCAICVNPCLTVTKNCDSVVIGQPNTVSGSVTNCGNIAITNIVIVDNLYGTLATIASLTPGQSQNYSVLVTNTCGSFPNFVTATGSTVCGIPITARATNTCVVTENPCIQVTKNCDTVVVGSANTVSGVVSNCGNVTLTNIVITDSAFAFVPPVTFASLAPGASLPYSRSVTNLCGNFPNTVTATARSTCGTAVTNTASSICVVTEAPCIRVTKTCDTVLVGQPNLVTAVVTNCGNVPLHGITVTDNLYGSVGTIATLAVGGTATLTKSVTNTCGNFPNTVTATGLSPCNTSVTNTSTATCVVTENPCIGVTKTCDTVLVGQANLVTAVVTNCGNVPLHGITVTDNIYGSVGTVALLAPGGTATLTKSVTNTCGNFPNTVTAIGLSPCNTGVTNTSTATCVVTENPCIRVTKTCDTVVVGQPNLVTAVVTNCGNVPLHGITVTDNLYGSVGTVALLAPGGTATLTKSVTNTCGNFPNTVTAIGLSPCNTGVTNTSTATCAVTENPCIGVTKTCDTVVIGQANLVTAIVTNCGNVPLHGITVTDNIYGSVGTVALLAPGGTATLTKSVTNTCGNFPNTLTAIGLSPCNTSVTNTSTATCVVTENPCVAVTANCNTVQIGAANTLSGSVSNCGNVTLTNVTITDNLYGTVATFASLAPGTSQLYLRTVTNGCGNAPNTVTATGRSLCGTQVSATATNTCVVQCPPCITVTKLVACYDTNNVCGPFGKTATGVRGDTQLPAFCYSITISNCGSIALTNVTVVDDKLGNLTTKFIATPATPFPVGGTITFITNAVSLAVNTTNTVTTTGQSALTGQSVNAADSAVALIRQASVACAMSVTSPDDMDGNPNDAHVSILGSGNHNVTFTVVVTAGSVPLANVTINSATLAGLGCPLPAPFTLAANSNFTYVCTASVNCANIPGGLLTNVAVITAQIDTSTGLCAHDSTGASVRVASTNSGPPCAVVIQCIPPSCLGDFVWEDVNRNGIQDAGEPGISNVVLRLLPCTGTNVLATTTTSPSGLYLFCNLAPGSYRVQMVVPGGYITTLQNSGTDDCLDSDLSSITAITDCTTLPAGVTNLCTDMGLFRPACLGDFVWDDYNRNGVQDAGEPGITNVTLQLQSCTATNVLQTTVTDVNGKYLFCGLVPGSYRVQVLVPGGYTVTLQNSTNDCIDSDANAAGLTDCVTLSSGETNLCTDIGMHRPACLGDYVWDDTNRNGLQDEVNTGHANVSVQLLSCAGALLGTTTTDANGYYLFCDLTPGSYRVRFALPTGYRFTEPNVGPDDCVDSDASTNTVDLGLAACVTLASGETNRCSDAGLVPNNPRICVTKEVACELPAGCGAYSHLATGAKTADDNQCPSFCYRVRVTNCGLEPLINVTVVDNVLDLAACNFPTTLAVNETRECIISGVTHCDGVTNTVTATGVGASSGISTNAIDTAAVVIRPIEITCNVTVNGQPFIRIPCDGQGHAVTNEVEICNTGSLPLSNITLFAPDIVALGGDCANVANLRLALLPGECTNVLLCIDMVTCPANCQIAFSNHMQVTATVDLTRVAVCSWTRNASNQLVAVTATTECEAQVGCTVPNACRVTGGGRQDDPLVYPVGQDSKKGNSGVRYVTHGGQVGAPVGNKVCTVLEEFYLGNPCIHGRWTHVRHEQGGLRGNFHARYYDTLDCACLDTNTTTGTVVVPGVNGAANQTYVNLIYGPGTVTEGVCNPDDHKVAGPQPRPAPANKIVFTGVGDWADPNGRRTPRATLFRVDIEDRSEPGGSHPKGSVNPPDRYRIRIWVLSADEIRLLKGATTSGGITDRYLLNFRNAISACIGLNVQDGATVPNGTAVFGVRAPDIDDGGELERGNHQIHPAIKECNPLDPQAPPVPPDRS